MRNYLHIHNIKNCLENFVENSHAESSLEKNEFCWQHYSEWIMEHEDVRVLDLLTSGSALQMVALHFSFSLKMEIFFVFICMVLGEDPVL